MRRGLRAGRPDYWAGVAVVGRHERQEEGGQDAADGAFRSLQGGRYRRRGRLLRLQGSDKSREWKDTYRAADTAERAAVEDGCARIKRYLDESQDYTFSPVKVERESEGEWHVIEVSFKHGAERKRIIFAFLPVRGQFAIGDID